MRVACGVGVQEWAALLQEIVEFSLFVAGSALLVRKSTSRSGNLQEDVGNSIKG
jgi:hypothetical protein